MRTILLRTFAWAVIGCCSLTYCLLILFFVVAAWNKAHWTLFALLLFCLSVASVNWALNYLSRERV